MARHRALIHRCLRRPARLILAAALGGALVVSVAALPAAAHSNDSYTVRSGDTLSQIAAKLGLPGWQALYAANRGVVSDPDLIYPGDRLAVPNGKASSSSSSSSSHQESAPRSERTNVSSDSSSSSSNEHGGVWDRLAQCESGGNWSINTGNGYYGGLQFSQSSWNAVGGSGLPSNASKAEQIARAEQLLDIQGWGAWPACSSKLGLR